MLRLPNQNMKHYALLLISLAITLSVSAIRPEDVPNVQLMDSRCYVTDICNVFTPAERAALDARCAQLRSEVGVEMAIVVVDEIDGDDEYEFAYKLFNLWHIGNSENNSGVLWLYVTSLRAMKIETGVGVEGLLPDGFLKRVLEEEVFPLMREDKTYDAFSAGMNSIEQRLTSDEAREELLIEQISDRTFFVDLLLFYFAVGFILLAILALCIYSKCQKMNGSYTPNNRKYAELARLFGICKMLTFVFPIPLLLVFCILSRYRRSLRYMPMRCPKCGKPMRVLSEAEEDAYLTHTQQAEENVHTVDYDVWLCVECGATTILDYPEYASAMYKRCPECGGHTYHKVSEKIVVPPTPLTSGRGERIWKCSACGCTKRIPFTIPPVPIVVGGGGRGGSGGGFSGGSFGGGFSGGGGAGGRF